MPCSSVVYSGLAKRGFCGGGCDGGHNRDGRRWRRSGRLGRTAHGCRPVHPGPRFGRVFAEKGCTRRVWRLCKRCAKSRAREPRRPTRWRGLPFARVEGSRPGLAAWAPVVYGSFDGEEVADNVRVRINGDVLTGTLGADADWGRMLPASRSPSEHRRRKFRQSRREQGRPREQIDHGEPVPALASQRAGLGSRSRRMSIDGMTIVSERARGDGDAGCAGTDGHEDRPLDAPFGRRSTQPNSQITWEGIRSNPSTRVSR